MNIRTLRYFVVAAETENVSRASERLHVVQSALSHQISALEAHLGGRLFNRIGRRIQLSEAGKVFLNDARAVLHAVDQAKCRVAKAANGTIGELRVTFDSNVSRSILVSEILLAFRKSFPEVALRLAPMPAEQIPEAIQSGAVDAGFTYITDSRSDLNKLFLQRADWLLVMPRNHRLVPKKHLRLKDLRDEAFIWHTVSPSIYESMMATCRAGGLTPNLVQDAQLEIMMVNLVSIGLGVCFVIDTATRRWPEDVVVVRKVENFSLPLHLCLEWQRDNESITLPHLLSIATRLAGAGSANEPVRSVGAQDSAPHRPRRSKIRTNI
jgi:DNA-binding transcriptional LysR family regulator